MPALPDHGVLASLADLEQVALTCRAANLAAVIASAIQVAQVLTASDFAASPTSSTTVGLDVWAVTGGDQDVWVVQALPGGLDHGEGGAWAEQYVTATPVMTQDDVRNLLDTPYDEVGLARASFEI